ncbi:MAG: hypothetical protein KDK89_03525 [Alphaproteobacteria bacterium]|nr:hypothetical protein [Alphaproteobacteria bacterium]
MPAIGLPSQKISANAASAYLPEARAAITGLVHDCPRWRQKYAAMLEMHKFLTLAITGLRLRSCECPNKMIAIIIKVLTEEG